MIKEKIYIFDCCNSLGGRNKARVKAKKKLLDRKTEEAVSLAQSHGRSSLIPDWCKAPEDINPPPEVESRSDTVQALEALESPEACTEQEPTKKGKKKKKKKKEKLQESLESEGADGGPGAVAAERGGMVACGPGESDTLTVPSEQPSDSGAACTSCDGERESESVTITLPSEQPSESGAACTSCDGERESESVTITLPSEQPSESGAAGTSCDGERESESVTITLPSEQPSESGAAGTSGDGESESVTVTLTVPPEQPPKSEAAGHGESEHPPISPIPGTCSGGAAVADVKVEDNEDNDEWLFSLTKRLDALGPIPYQLPEGWQDFDEVSYTLMLHDALHAVGLEPEDLPSDWSTVVTKKNEEK